MLRLENLSKRYKTGDLALNNVTLECALFLMGNWLL